MKFIRSFLLLSLAAGHDGSPQGTPAPTDRRKRLLRLLIGFAVFLAVAGGGTTAYILAERAGVFLKPSAEIRTDIPEIAGYVDLFNASQDTFKLELVYSQSPGSDLRNGSLQTDLIAGRGLIFQDAPDYFQPLDKLFEAGILNEEAFYRPLLSLGKNEQEQLLLPVSFDIPAVMFDAANAEKISPLLIPLDDLRSLSGEFNVRTKKGYTAMGFSPRWSPEFLYMLTELFGADFSESATNGLVWQENGIRTALEYARTWVDETNGGMPAEDYFREKYLYDPGYKLVKEGRTRFGITSGSAFFLLPEEMRAGLDFRWVGRNGRIPTADGMIFLGIPKNARNRPAAEAFIRWFYSPETQRSLLETQKLKRTRAFGLAGGFSALVEVTENIFPQVYPYLIGHIPPQSYLAFHPRLPARWQLMLTDVIEPWLGRMADEDPLPENLNGSLSAQLDEWLLRHGKF